ncbi:MAG TPA: FecR domain-containing protein, partial [Kofleriaceae bacterium]|nr:FecR domain-containing protein [Kofleriaceae bacterium]
MSERDGDDRAPLSPEEIEALEAWQVPDPPAGFADRVLAAQSAAPPVPESEANSVAAALAASPTGPTGRRRLLLWSVVGAAAVAALLLTQLRSPGGPTGAGSAAPLERRSIQLGQRGVAVAEAGALLSWEIEGGAARVAQRAGDVFYRVERGGRFEVETPHGTVRVTGTCFRVELNAMKTPWQAVAGAAIGAAVVVTVYEGSVLFAGSDGEERAVEAGQALASGEGSAVVGDARGGAEAAGEAPVPAAPGADVSRDELLRRDAIQRAEIGKLRSRMRELESAGGQPGARVVMDGEADSSGRPWFDPSKEDLIRMAS